MNNVSRNSRCLFVTAALLAALTAAPVVGDEPSTAGLVRISDSCGTDAKSNCTAATKTRAFDSSNCGSIGSNQSCTAYARPAYAGYEYEFVGQPQVDLLTVNDVWEGYKAFCEWTNRHGDDDEWGYWLREQSKLYHARNRAQSEYLDGLCDQWWAGQWHTFRARNRLQSELWGRHLRAKFAYFTPTGCCGQGCPPAGFYQMVYAADPHYYDQRDSRVYASPTTGVPMVVPLAPNVNYTMNYGRGIPSSRLTPISRIAR